MLSGNVSASAAGALKMFIHLFLSENKLSLESVRVRLIINCIVKYKHWSECY